MSDPASGVTEARDGATVILTISQPARRNALSMAIREGLTEALDRIEADREVRAVVLTGAGGTFSAGGDISGMDVTDIPSGRERFRRTHRMVHALIQSSKPLIAAVEGWAAGAGMSLALCCDTVVAAEDSRFMASFGKIGLVADCALFHTLPQRVGMGRARQILLYGEPVGAVEGERIGLVDHVTPKGGALDRALERARAVAEGAPLPIALTKRYLAEGLEAALEFERDAQAMMFVTADHAEGRAAFLGKRKPVFKGA
jgi:2-(1,2-epoxy-1,2-dihydrophenyl)acetyl-CoA isomerase